MKHRVLHHVPYDRVFDWLACGWVISIPNGPSHHQHYGVVVEWLCDCKMVRPK